jgi:hypothetical protein
VKRILLAVTLLAAVSLVACTAPPSRPTQTTTSLATEETAIRTLVENFGMKLQNVSLQAPDAAQELQQQYSEFVSPVLLDRWIKDISRAPGRIVSSPWPDRIEITTLSQTDPDTYEIMGDLIQITSTEVGNGEVATRMPIRIVVNREQERWLISDYAEVP